MAAGRPRRFVILCYIIPWLVRPAGGAMPSGPTFYLSQHCSGHGRCAMANSYCKLQTPTCGLCSCLPGFVPFVPDDFSSMACRRAAHLDDACSPSGPTACAGENVECSALLRRCVCRRGFKRDVAGAGCVPFIMDKTASELCFDSSQCYHSLECINFACACRPGFKASEFHCTRRHVSDACRDDADCQATPFAQCHNRTCQCRPGFQPMASMNAESARQETICVGQAAQLKAEGQPCSPEGGFVCAFPLACSACAISKSPVNAGQCVNLTKLAQLTSRSVATTPRLLLLSLPVVLLVVT